PDAIPVRLDERLAAGALDASDVGAVVGQQHRRHRPGDPPREVEHLQPVEHTGHVSSPFVSSAHENEVHDTVRGMSQSSGLSLEDKMALRELVERYALAADTRNPDVFGSCFTKDGVNRTPKVPESLGPTLERNGRDEIGSSILGLKRYFATM